MCVRACRSHCSGTHITITCVKNMQNRKMLCNWLLNTRQYFCKTLTNQVLLELLAGLGYTEPEAAEKLQKQPWAYLMGFSE